MVTSRSLNESIDKAVKRYSSLFALPSHKTLLIWLFVMCLLTGLLITAALQLSPLYWLAFGLSLGVTFFTVTILSDYTIQRGSLDANPIFNMRRCTALSLYSLLFWLIFILIGVIVSLSAPNVWFKFFLLGFSVALALRILVFTAVSFLSIAKTAIYGMLQPVLYTISTIYTISAVKSFSLNASLLSFFFLSVAVTITAVVLYMSSINQIGSKILGVGSFSVLKAFIANWTEDVNTPFEQLFERFSQQSEIQLSALEFRNAKGVVKAAIIVPAFHPGPFKNVGSSTLPYAIQTTLENKLKNCVIMVPHGLSGHNLDLATQSQNELVLDRVIKLSEVSDFGPVATRLIKVKRNGASVTCQVFNGCALTSLTLAPETMEDLPPELNILINQAAKKKRFSAAIAIDAHNSINGLFKIDEAIKPLQEAALASLTEASKEETTNFQIGAVKTEPQEFSLKNGMGPGGIGALVIKVGDQASAYVTIDGNNMISGLREKILTGLSEVGISEGEVFTTDTHMVNAVVLNARGYHPVGEAMNQGLLIKHIKQATADALSNLEPAEAGWRIDVVSGVKVIGEKQIESMSLMLEQAMKRAKKLAVSIFPIAGLVLAALFLLL